MMAWNPYDGTMPLYEPVSQPNAMSPRGAGGGGGGGGGRRGGRGRGGGGPAGIGGGRYNDVNNSNNTNSPPSIAPGTLVSPILSPIPFYNYLDGFAAQAQAVQAQAQAVAAQYEHDASMNSKRPRVDPYFGFTPGTAVGNTGNSGGRYASGSGHRYSGSGASSAATPMMIKQKQTRVYSDFRVAKIKIGELELDETVQPHQHQQHHNNRDSRLRLYFKNSDTVHAASPDPQLSDRERALTEPDRLSISMFQGSKRMVIPVQDGLESVIFNRGDGHFKIKSKGWALFEEIDNTMYYQGVMNHFVKCGDLTQGQLENANGVIDVWIDKMNPLPMEPKWTRGNIQDYIDARSKFRTLNVLQVEDPENITDFDSVMGLWTRESNIATAEERQTFADTQLYKLPYMLELCSKILAPTNYYVSKNAAIDAHPTNAHLAAQIVESGSIPALISPAVNALLATATFLGKEAKLDDDKFVEYLKGIIYHAPEPIIWRSLDGLFGRRAEPLNFKPDELFSSFVTTPDDSMDTAE